MNKEIFKKAHKLTKEFINENKELKVNYRVQFSIFLKEVIKEFKTNKEGEKRMKIELNGETYSKTSYINMMVEIISKTKDMMLEEGLTIYDDLSGVSEWMAFDYNNDKIFIDFGECEKGYLMYNVLNIASCNDDIELSKITKKRIKEVIEEMYDYSFLQK